MQTLDFRENKTQIIDFETLKRTHKENDIFGNPLKEMYHFQLINEIAERCNRQNLDFRIKDIFAVKNQNRNFPGVVVLPQVEETHGENAVEAHILRRVFANIEITNNSTEELTSNIALAYHQNGIQIGVGQMVVVCQNQTILSSDRIFSTYGENKMNTTDLLNSVSQWLGNFFEYRERDINIINQMKEIEMKEKDVLRLIGLLTSLRVSKDSTAIATKPKTYPLNQSQISQFTEDYLIERENKRYITMWDIYNLATDLYKPDKMDIPAILPQNAEMFNVLTNFQTV